MTRGAILPLCAIVALGWAFGCAHGRGPSGNAWAHYELTVSHDVDPPAASTSAAPDPAPAPSELALAGVRLHGLIGDAQFGYHIGLDLAAGSTIRGGGFAYDVALLPIGGGVRLGATSAIMLGGGIGAMGAVGTLDDAVTLPIELTGEFGGGRVRLLGRARIAYVAGAAGRASGSQSLAFADEVEAMLAIRIGHHYEPGDFPTGNGYFAGVAVRELLGARFVGFTLGYSIDLATRPPRPIIPE